MSEHPNTICVVGLGYIGLPTAAMFALKKKKVIGVDVKKDAVDTINQGRIHIVEPELDTIVQAVVENGNLRATMTPEPADAFIIAVPTPFKGNHEPDLRYVRQAAESIAPWLKKGDTVILESTSPVGATEAMTGWLAAARPDLKFPEFRGNHEGLDVHVAYCPERVLPGHVVRELVENDRIIGGMTEKCSKKASDVYRIFVEGALLITDARLAEMSKLTENSYRDVNIAFANELSIICGKLGLDVWELIRLANHHPRVNILSPGAGVGGHCIAVDPWFIVDSAPEEARMIKMARDVNNGKPHWVIGKIKDKLAAIASWRKEEELTVAVLGLAFKPDIDDLRESPALEIARELSDEVKAKLLLVEPNIGELPGGMGRGKLADLDTALKEADLLAVLVGHRQFKSLEGRLRAEQSVVDVVGVTKVGG